VDKTFLIAEMGSCHDGDIEKAMRLVHLAKTAGFDCVKGQFYSSAERLAERRNAPDYLPIYQKYQMPRDWLPILKDECDMVGIEWMVTTYLKEDIGVVAPFVQRFKIASFEAGDREFIEAHYPFCDGAQLIISTGMMGWGEFTDIAHSVKYLHGILHCVSAYPADSANLGALHEMQQWLRGFPYNLKIGYSDHTTDPDMGGWAVAAGAEIIEAHIRLDDTDRQNPDYDTALSPEYAVSYVRRARAAEKAMGDGIKRPQEVEEAMMGYLVCASS